MKTKPFDLKAALAGAKVVTRDGRAVTGVRRDRSRESFPVLATTEYNGSPVEYPWTTEGYFLTRPGSKFDLFLVDEYPVRTAPFNLEAALKGEPVVTRDGRPVAEIKRFETVDRIYGVLDGIVTGWLPDGTSRRVGDSEIDLLMVAPEPKIREVWLNVYPHFINTHPTEKDANFCAYSHRIGKARRVLIPEEE